MTLSINPLVSIIIPCFNNEGFVGEAIESALTQTYTNTEIIVIDDGSTDGSLDVIRSFGSRIQWRTGPNSGACAARNKGIKLARGRFVQFLDADDILGPDKLSVQVPPAMERAGQIVYCGYETISKDGRQVVGREVPTRGDYEDSVCFILNHYGLATPSPLHRHDVLESVGGFREHLRCSQERDLHLRLACSGVSFVYLARCLFKVRQVPNSLSSDFVDVLDQHEDLARTALEILGNENKLTEQRREALAGFLARDARAYLRRGLVERGDRYFKLARSIHPAGGRDIAYGPGTRSLVRLLGPHLVERLVSIKRN